MASFVVDFTEVKFAAANTGYKDITITGMPQAGVNCTITGTDASSFGFRIPGSDQNVYRVYTTSHSNIGVSANQKTATFKITNLSDSTDYVEVSLLQCAYYGAPEVRGVGNVYDNIYAYYAGDAFASADIFAEYRTDNVGTYVILYVDGYEGTTTLSESWAYYTADSVYTDTGFKQIKVGATNNYDAECRRCTITFPGSGNTGNSSILWQNPYPSSTAGCTSPIRFSGSGGTERITLKTDGHPAANIDYMDWYSNDGLTYTIVETGSGTLYYDVTVGANQSDKVLRGAILFERWSTHKKYGFALVFQDPSSGPVPTLTAEPDVLDYPASGGARVLDVTYATSLSTNESSFPDWLGATYTSIGPSERSYTITAASNSIAEARSFNFELADANMSLVVPITQAAGTPASLSISPTSNSVGSSSGTVQITVTSSGISDVQYSISGSWITYGSKSGNVYTFNYAEKTSTGQRTGTITFYGGGLSKTYTLIQAGASQIVVSPTSEEVSSSSGTVSVSVSGASNISYSISGNWLTYSSKSGSTYVFAYSANTSGSSRTATVTFSATGAISGTYTIAQEAASTDTLTATPSSLSFTSSGGEKTVVLTYTGVLHLRSDEPDWVDVSYSVGSSPKTYYISAAANTSEYAREWDAYFYDDNSALYVPVIQNGTTTPSLSVSPTSGSVDGNSGRTGITLTVRGIRSSDINYQISGSWLSYSSRTDYTFYFSYPENTSSSSRTATITFSAFGKTATYTLTQQAPGVPASLSISPTSKTVTGAPGRVDITVNQTGIENLQYTFSSNSGFVFSHIEGNVYVFSYSSNTSTLQSRSATITFSGAGLSRTFTLSQQPQSTTKTLNLIPTSDSVDGGSGYVYVTVSANRMSYSNISRSINGSWLSYVSSAGWIDKYLYRANPTSAERTATVTYTGEGGLTKTYTIVQDAGVSPDDPRSLKVYPKKLRYYGEGGSKKVSFTNRPDGGIGYEITYIDGSGWLSITDSGPDKYVAATENGGIRRRASIRFYDVNDRSNYVIVPVIQGNIDGYDSIWMDDLFYPEDRDDDGIYYYRVTDQNSNQDYFVGVSAKPTNWGGDIGGIDIPRLVDGYLSSSLNNRGSSDWADMIEGYCTVDVYNMTESGYPGVVDATFKYWNDWSRFEKRYDYTRSLNDPINGKGCDNMIIPFCVYYDDAATFSIVDTEKNGNVNTYTLSSPSSPFAMRYESFYDTKKLEYKQDDEVIFSYDMDHCGPGAFIYRNRFGGWDSFLIEGNISKTDNYTKLNWRKKGEYNQRYSIDSLKYIDEKVTDSVNIDTTFEAYTGWLSDEEAERLVFHLLSSPIVYFQNLHKENQLFDTDPMFNLIPIRITASSAEYKKFRNGKRLVNYLITFEKGNIEKVRN